MVHEGWKRPSFAAEIDVIYGRFYQRLNSGAYSGAMARNLRQEELQAAFDSIEEMILPGISMMLETLIDAATHSQPGMDAAVYAAELRTIGAQVEALTRQVEALHTRQDERAVARESSAA